MDEINCDCIGLLIGGKWDNLYDCNRKVYATDGISPTITTCGGGNQEVKIAEPTIAAMRGREPQVMTPKRTEHGKAVRKAYESGELETSRHTMQRLELRNDGVTNTLTTVQKDNIVIEQHFRIRKLTPKECWRLMGFEDSDFDKASAVVSNSQLYKQAGNSICLNVLEAIFGQMIDGGHELFVERWK